MDRTVAEARAPESYTDLVAGCVRAVETDRVPPLARALAAASRLLALAGGADAREGVFACWADDVRNVIGAFAGAKTVAEADREPQRLLRTLEASCNRLIEEHAEVQPVLELWRRLDKLRDPRPVFGLWRVRVQQSLRAHEEASAVSGDDRRRRYTQATADVKALIDLHAQVLAAHQVWDAVVARRTDGDGAHGSFSDWHASLETVMLPLAERLQALAGPRPGAPLPIDDLRKAYRDFSDSSQARVKEFDELKDALRRRRSDVDGWAKKLLPELAQASQKLSDATAAVAQASSMRGSSGSFDTGRYGAGLMAGGGLGLAGGVVSCVSDLGRHGTADHIIFGPLVGAAIGLVIVGLAHAASSAEHSSSMASRYQAKVAELHSAQQQAVASRDRAASLRNEVAAVFVPTVTLDEALGRLQGTIDASTRLMS